eukprot:1514138-Rhodomonas_salina.4
MSVPPLDERFTSSTQPREPCCAQPASSSAPQPLAAGCWPSPARATALRSCGAGVLVPAREEVRREPSASETATPRS